MSGLAVVLNTGEADVPVLLYSGLSCAHAVVDDTININTNPINIIFFMLLSSHH